jgi:hypothetical protein
MTAGMRECALARASAAGERAQVAPGSHGHANRDETRILATPANVRHYAQSRMNRPPPHVHGKEGVDGSSPSEGLSQTNEAAAKGGFLVAGMDTVDHLLTKEGIDSMARADNPESCWKTQRLVARAGALESWGQVLGTNHGQSKPNDSYPHAIGTK